MRVARSRRLVAVELLGQAACGVAALQWTVRGADDVVLDARAVIAAYIARYHQRPHPSRPADVAERARSRLAGKALSASQA